MSITAPVATERFTIVYGPELATYSFGDEHPLQAEPLHAHHVAALRARLAGRSRRSRIEPPRPATLSELLTVHSYPYVQAVQQGQAIARGEKAQPT